MVVGVIFDISTTAIYNSWKCSFPYRDGLDMNLNENQSEMLVSIYTTQFYLLSTS